MAVTDAYASAATYRAIADKDSTAEDTEILDDLRAISRYLDGKLGQFFTQDASAVARLFEGNGERVLRLDGIEGCPGIASTTGLVVKVDLNGDYDVTDTGETLTINTDFWVAPANAAQGAEARPWTALEVTPSTTVLSTWPKRRRAVQVTAIFGWPAVPKSIERATCLLAAIMRMETARAIVQRSEIGEMIEASREARGIVDNLSKHYRVGAWF